METYVLFNIWHLLSSVFDTDCVLCEIWVEAEERVEHRRS